MFPERAQLLSLADAADREATDLEGSESSIPRGETWSGARNPLDRAADLRRVAKGYREWAARTK